ncbi:MAG: hypothetical protein JWM76_5238 [Pseudonocardiales bacterium]|nr:hypothetical protein [Pseudonocardiales bacterium]
MAVPTFTTYQQAAYGFADLVDEIGDEYWTSPALGDWDLRSLVGHTSRALVTVRTYLQRRTDVAAVAGPAQYLARATPAGEVTDPHAVARRGREAGAALGSEPATTVRALVEEVVEIVYAVEGDPIIETIAGGMRLSHYLPTRTFELAVHSLDIAAAADLETTLAGPVLSEALALAVQAAQLGGDGQELLLALTGRRRLDDGFSVV